MTIKLFRISTDSISSKTQLKLDKQATQLVGAEFQAASKTSVQTAGLISLPHVY